MSMAKTIPEGRQEQTRENPKKMTRSNRVATEVLLTPTSTVVESTSLSDRLIFHPETYGILCWDLLLISLIVYQAFAIPYIICFNIRIAGTLGYFEFFVGLIFMCDIAVNFNTAYFAKGVFITNRKLIAKHYFQFWFWADLVSTFPYFWLSGAFLEEPEDSNNSATMSTNATRIVKLIRILRFLRILRLIRLAKLKRILFKIEDFISSNFVAGLFVFLRLIFLIFFLAHWTACWSYYVSYMDQETNADTWTGTELKKADNELYDIYITSLYWAFTTMSTVGYGDVIPFTVNEKIYATFAMILACGTFAYTVGSIGNLVSKSSAEATEYREQVMSVNKYMKKKDLPKDLQFRVRRYLEYLWENKKKNYLNEKEILSLLSEPLRDELYDHVHGAVVKSCPSFENLETHFIGQLSKLLETETFAPADVIFEMGELSTTIYFIQHGTVDVFHHFTNSSFRELRTKQFFGEIAFFTEKPRCASVRCMDFVDLFSLRRSDLERVMEKFPLSKEKIELMAKKCAHGDFSALQIRCYICKELGHTATRCSRILVNFNHERLKQKWLESRKAQSKYVNPNLDLPSPVRKSRIRPKLDFTSRNIVGFPRSPHEMYPARPLIWGPLKNYEHCIEQYQAEDCVPANTPAISPDKKKEATFERAARPRYTVLLRDDDVKEAMVKEETRSLAFRTELIRSNPPAPVVEIETFEAFDGGEKGLSNEVSVLSDDTDKPLRRMDESREELERSRNEGDFDYNPRVDVSLLRFDVGDNFAMPNSIIPNS